jgi:hypothetical protein
VKEYLVLNGFDEKKRRFKVRAKREECLQRVPVFRRTKHDNGFANDEAFRKPLPQRVQQRPRAQNRRPEVEGSDARAHDVVFGVDDVILGVKRTLAEGDALRPQLRLRLGARDVWGEGGITTVSMARRQ